MNAVLVHSAHPVTLVGGGAADIGDLGEARRIGPTVVAADGGAGLCLEAGLIPDAVIGDMDSLDPMVAAGIPADRVHRIAEQDSTDFDKALRSVAAPLVIGVGFLGNRIDHQLAALHVLVSRYDRAVVLIDKTDVVCHLPRHLALDLAPDERVSLFPMKRVRGRSAGLAWPIDGLDFHPSERIGTSNKATGPVEIAMDAPGMLLILPRARLTLLAAALRRAVPPTARAE